MYWHLLRCNRDFRLLFLGTLISLGGDWFLTVALLDLVLQLTGSATLASLMLLCQSLPLFIFTPTPGHALDPPPPPGRAAPAPPAASSGSSSISRASAPASSRSWRAPPRSCRLPTSA